MCIEVFYRFLLQVFLKKMPFFQDQLQNLSFVSAIFGHKFQIDLHRGQPLALLGPNESIWHVCRVFRFLRYLVQKKFYLEYRRKFINFWLHQIWSAKAQFRLHNSPGKWIYMKRAQLEREYAPKNMCVFLRTVDFWCFFSGSPDSFRFSPNFTSVFFYIF